MYMTAPAAPASRRSSRCPSDRERWWTMRHTAVMLVMLTLVACGAAVWVRTTANRKRQRYQAVLNERSRVGRELHDTLEQGLTGIALQIEAVAGSFETSPDLARQSL